MAGMTERAFVTQGVQLGVEATPGDGAAADLLINSFTIEPGVKVDMARFRPTGQKLESIITPSKEWIECKVKGLASYSELQYLLAGVLGPNQVSHPEADGAAELWKFKLNARDVDDVQTYSFEQGDSVNAHKFAYGLVTELDMTFSRSSCDVGGNLIAHALEDGITLTADPVSIEEAPLLPAEVDVYLDATHAGLGTTKLTRSFKADLKMGDKAGPVWTLNSAVDGFASHVEKAPKLELKLLVEADDEGMGILSEMRTGSTLFVRIQATSPTEAAPGKPYQLKLDGSYKVSDVAPFSDEDGVYAIEYTLAAVYDAASGLAFEATLRNKEISLATPVT
jgi:hypothetical protein